MKQLVNMSIIFFGLAWLWLIADYPEWYWLFIILLAGVIIPELLFPPKRKSTSKRSTKKSKVISNRQKATTTKRKLSDEELLSTNLKELNGYDFERLVAMYYRDKGYNPQLVGGLGDHEVEIIITYSKE